MVYYSRFVAIFTIENIHDFFSESKKWLHSIFVLPFFYTERKMVRNFWTSQPLMLIFFLSKNANGISRIRSIIHNSQKCIFKIFSHKKRTFLLSKKQKKCVNNNKYSKKIKYILTLFKKRIYFGIFWMKPMIFHFTFYSDKSEEPPSYGMEIFFCLV